MADVTLRLTPEQRRWLSDEVRKRLNTIECHGCGERIERTSPRRRYCSRACANRHWHVRRKAENPEYRHAR